jgi:hypothetical protein
MAQEWRLIGPAPAGCPWYGQIVTHAGYYSDNLVGLLLIAGRLLRGGGSVSSGMRPATEKKRGNDYEERKKVGNISVRRDCRHSPGLTGFTFCP